MGIIGRGEENMAHSGGRRPAPAAGIPTFYCRYIKRGLDVLLSSFGLMVLSPVFLFLIIAIKLDSKGPVLFKQKRIGIHKRPLYMEVSYHADGYAEGHAYAPLGESRSVHHPHGAFPAKNLPG